MSFLLRLTLLLGFLSALCGCDCGQKPPVIEQFRADPPSIAQGGLSTLSWTVKNATSVGIEPQVVTVGNSAVVQPSDTTQYTLTAHNAAGSAQATTTVEVSVALAALTLSGPDDALGGASFEVTVTAVDRTRRVMPGYRGTVGLEVDDPAAALPASYAFTEVDQGAHVFQVRLVRQGQRTLTVRDAAAGLSASLSITVRAGNPTTLSLVSGDGQRGAAGSMLAEPLKVKVSDSLGNGVPGVQVAFAGVTGGGRVDPVAVDTDGLGEASTRASFGASRGPYTFQAIATGLSGSPLTFTADATSGPPASIIKMSGDNQRGPGGTVLPLPLVARVVDATNNPVAGVTVNFVASVGGSVAPTSAVTAANGEVSSIGTLGAVRGANLFEARVAQISPVGFFATVETNAPASLRIVDGNGQSAGTGAPLPQPLRVQVLDMGSAGIPGITVSWTASGGGAVTSATSVSGPTGIAQMTATLGPIAGPQAFTAAVVGLAPASFTASAQTAGTALVYTNPATGTEKVRVVRGPASSATSIELEVRAAVPLTAYSAGFNLAVDTTRVQLGAPGLTPGTALNPGLAPQALAVALPSAGPLRGVLVSGLSQKSSGAGAVPNDAAIAAGALLYTLRLDFKPGALTGTVFDGGSLLRAGLKDRAGADVAVLGDFALGRLEVR